MIRKKYLRPLAEVCQADVDEQLLAGSVGNVTASGLDDDEALQKSDNPEDMWDSAW